MAGPGWVVTPQGMLDYMREVDRYVDAIAAAAQASPAIPWGVRLGWFRFLSDWKTFYREHEGFLDRLSGSVADTTERYETDATKWRATLEPFMSEAAKKEIVFDDAKRPGGPQVPTLADVNDLLFYGGAAVLGAWFLLRRK